MRTFYKLFARSPFVSLQYHMDKVGECVKKTEKIFDALAKGDYDEVKKIGAEISVLEHDADIAKADIRNNLGKNVFLPVDKGKLLEMLSIQDNIADKCEDIGVLLGMKKVELSETFKDDFLLFLEKNIETYNVAQSIVQQFDMLQEASFSGAEAEKTKNLIAEVAFKEHEADVLQQKLLSRLFELEDEMSYGTFWIWLKIFKSLGALSNSAENLGDRVSTLLKLK